MANEASMVARQTDDSKSLSGGGEELAGTCYSSGTGSEGEKNSVHATQEIWYSRTENWH